MRSRSESTTEYTDRYRQGLKLYCSGRLNEAAELLGELRDCKELVGRLGRYYEGLAHRSMGIDAIQAGRFAQAEQHFRSAIACIGRRADLTEYLCGIYARGHRFQRCADELDKSVRAGDAEGDSWRRLAQAQWQAGRREQAFMTLTQALRALGPQGPLLMQLGLFHAAEERFDEACRSLTDAARIDCARPETHYYLGLASVAAGDVRQAVRSLQRAWELRPEDIALAMQLAIAARAAEQGGHSVVIRPPQDMRAMTAETHIRQLAAYVQSEPDFVDALLALPPGEADEELFCLLACVLQTALAEHDDYADLHHRASRVMLRLDRVEPAMVHAQRALELNPRYVGALVHLAGLCASVGRRGEAVAHLDAAIRCGADWPDVHCLAGELLSQDDKPLRARKHLARALELKDGYARAANALAALAA